MIGRQKEKSCISQAIRDNRIILIEGAAGIGKTTLVEWAATDAEANGVEALPIVDFYDTRFHSFQGLEQAIAGVLNTRLGGTFAAYQQARQKEPQADLWTQFKQGYESAVGDKYILLRFDTVERLAYERDSEEVLIDCEVEDPDAPSWKWLLQRVGQLPNTTILLAARPTPDDLLPTRLANAYHSRFLHLKMGGFDLAETTDYFRANEFGRQQVVNDSPEMVEKIHLLADGRPILIALALDWLERGMWDAHLYPMEVDALRQLKAQSRNVSDSLVGGQTWEDTKHHFESVLVQQIRKLETPMDVALRYVAMCRKGCNAHLLAQLMDITLSDATQQAEHMLELSFVKRPRSGSRDMFFLHDEMYDLVEKYVWIADWPDYSEQARVDGLIINWYEEQITQIGRAIRDAVDWRERRKLRHHQQVLQTEQLYYRLDQYPRNGYRMYSHLIEQAIGGRELEWDVWLHNELLSFIVHRPARWQTLEERRVTKTNYDARRFWINRNVALERYNDTIRIAKKLLATEKREQEPPLFRSGLLITLATAQAHLGGKHATMAVENFDQGIQEIVSHFGSTPDRWLPQYLLGTANLFKGLAHRSTHRLTEAQEAYLKAIETYESMDYQLGMAEALNNLAFVVAQQGMPEQALDHCNRALEIREKLGDEYAIGLSLNTKGIILERLDKPDAAIYQSLQALSRFTEIGSERGIILAEINLGRAYRRKGRSQDWGQQESDFKTGERHLLHVIESQVRQGLDVDVYYQIQANNELGCLYRDWAATLFEKQLHEHRVELLLNSADSYLQMAIKLASGDSYVEPQQWLQLIDSLEDLARVYYLRARSNPRDKSQWLQMMESLLCDAQTWAEQRMQGWDELVLILGKIYFQRARQAHEIGDLQLAAMYFALASGNAEAYYIDAPELKKMVKEASHWLMELQPIEAKRQIETMRTEMRKRNLPDNRLRYWVENVVRPRLGVSWND